MYSLESSEIPAMQKYELNNFAGAISPNELAIHETRNISDKNRCFGASSAIIKVT